MDILGYGKIKLVINRGFYSAANINDLYKATINSLLGQVPRCLIQGLYQGTWGQHAKLYQI